MNGSSMFRGKVWAWMAAAGLCVVAGSMACGLESRSALGPSQQASIAEQVFGTAVASLARFSVENQADKVLHGHSGVYVEKLALKDSIFRRMLLRTAHVGHLHLAGEETKEIMPWLQLAIWLEPHNAEHYDNTAFWMGYAGFIDKEWEVLEEAQRRNPRSYLVYLARARFHAKAGDREPAKRALDRAITLWPVAPTAKSRLALDVALRHRAEARRYEAMARAYADMADRAAQNAGGDKAQVVAAAEDERRFRAGAAECSRLAESAWGAAAAAWPGENKSAEAIEKAVDDRRAMLARRATLCELDGDRVKAIDFMSEMVQYDPGTTRHISERIEVLRSGGQPAESAEERWQALRRQDYRHFCGAAEAEHEESGQNALDKGGARDSGEH